MYKISNFYNSSKRLGFVGKLIAILIYIITIPIIIINLTLIIKTLKNPNEIPSFLGFKSFVIITESMQDTIMPGDAIIVKNVKKEELGKGDIITFFEGGITNTHRIVEIYEENGKTRYVTKGDNNVAKDRNAVPYEQVEGKYLFRIKGFGKFAEIIKSKITLIVLLVILVFISIWQVRLGKKKLERKQKRYEYEKNIKMRK